MADNQITPFQLTDQFTMDNFNQRINETNTALADICVGQDGTVYSTAGNAVRSQVTQLKDDLEAVDSRLSESIDEIEHTLGEVVVEKTGKNLFGLDNQQTTFASGYMTMDINDQLIQLTRLKNFVTNSNSPVIAELSLTAGTYSISVANCNISGVTSAKRYGYIGLKNSANTVISYADIGRNRNNTFTLTEDTILYAFVGLLLTGVNEYTNVSFNVQLEKGSTVTPYEKYNRTTYLINQSEVDDLQERVSIL